MEAVHYDVVVSQQSNQAAVEWRKLLGAVAGLKVRGDPQVGAGALTAALLLSHSVGEQSITQQSTTVIKQLFKYQSNV